MIITNSQAPTATGSFAAASRMEWLKLRSLRSTWWMLAIYAASMIGLAILALSVLTPGRMSPSDLASFDPTEQGFEGGLIGEIITGIVGVLAFTGEYSSGMIRATLAAVPRRPLAFAAKATVLGGAVLASSEVLAFAAFFAGEAALRPSIPHASLTQPAVLRAVLMGGAYLFLTALIGLGLGALLRHGAAAIGVLLGLLFALPLFVHPLPDNASIEKFLPQQVAANSLTAVKPVPGYLSPWLGLLMMCLYTMVILAAGYWAFTRRDA
jgi:ABC-2 type transport system permease protein